MSDQKNNNQTSPLSSLYDLQGDGIINTLLGEKLTVELPPSSVTGHTEYTATIELHGEANPSRSTSTFGQDKIAMVAHRRLCRRAWLAARQDL